ncbi:MAG: PAS domain S-box protein, partial [Candidatus Polarisedimenticolia bacterium]
MQALARLLGTDGFMPHGHCYLWQPALVWLHAASDGLIFLAYVSIPVTLAWFVRRRADLPFHWMFAAFGLFIVACGLTHAMEIWTLWVPLYWLSGTVKAVTAAVSVATAILMVRLVPQALRLPSPAALQRETAKRDRAEIRFRGVMEAAPDALVISGADGRIAMVNRQTEILFGYSRDELIGQPVEILVPPRLRQAHPVHRAAYMRQPGVRPLRAGME